MKKHLCTTKGCGRKNTRIEMKKTSNGNFCNEKCEQDHIAHTQELRRENLRKQKKLAHS